MYISLWLMINICYKTNLNKVSHQCTIQTLPSQCYTLALILYLSIKRVIFFFHICDEFRS